MKIAFRSDASTAIGLGHVMRCRTLAQRLAAAGHECCFVCRDLPGNLNRVVAQDFSLTVLPASLSDFVPQEGDPIHADWARVDWRTDAIQTRVAIGSSDWMVVDHYAFDARWEQEIRSCARAILVLDDLADRPHDCELLLDQSLGRKAEDYNGYVRQDTRLLLGAEYVLLRPEFSAMRPASLARRQNGRLRHILVGMGGIDTNNVVGHILQAIAALPQVATLCVSVIVSGRTLNIDGLRSLVARMPCPCQLHLDAPNVAHLMAEADLAISASGMMGYELACMGVPILLLPVSPIQTEVALDLMKISEACVVTNWTQNPTGKISTALKDFFEHLTKLPPSCRRISRAFDGNGTARVAEAMSLFDLRIPA